MIVHCIQDIDPIFALIILNKDAIVTLHRSKTFVFLIPHNGGDFHGTAIDKYKSLLY